jgi:hypothetical protein
MESPDFKALSKNDFELPIGLANLLPLKIFYRVLATCQANEWQHFLGVWQSGGRVNGIPL